MSSSSSSSVIHVTPNGEPKRASRFQNRNNGNRQTTIEISQRPPHSSIVRNSGRLIAQTISNFDQLTLAPKTKDDPPRPYQKLSISSKTDTKAQLPKSSASSPLQSASPTPKNDLEQLKQPLSFLRTQKSRRLPYPRFFQQCPISKISDLPKPSPWYPLSARSLLGPVPSLTANDLANIPVPRPGGQAKVQRTRKKRQSKKGQSNNSTSSPFESEVQEDIVQKDCTIPSKKEHFALSLRDIFFVLRNHLSMTDKQMAICCPSALKEKQKPDDIEKEIADLLSVMERRLAEKTIHPSIIAVSLMMPKK